MIKNAFVLGAYAFLFYMAVPFSHCKTGYLRGYMHRLGSYELFVKNKWAKQLLKEHPLEAIYIHIDFVYLKSQSHRTQTLGPGLRSLQVVKPLHN